MFEKILIANRGEIAVRIIGTCQKMGIASVAVYSEADARAPYVAMADEAIAIGPPLARESYLNGDRIIQAALTSGSQAVHPGYGFLSENAGFAQAVSQAGLTFIGPPSGAMSLLGDKVAAKALAVKTGVPVVPGHHEPVADPDQARAIAAAIGYPVLLKPAAGGGGRGMRIVHQPEGLEAALIAGREETRKAFADDRFFIEKFIIKPRHIEIQLLADSHGQVIYLGERECSIQRRYQKVIEETPSPVVDPALRREMGQMACGLAKAAGYQSAGTAEFIVDQDKRFYFLEMNTRLQVEHPVTELVTGLDLVELQIRIAAGQPLALTQEQIHFNGWAIEARVCAEDPDRGFLPTTGIITRYAVPRGQNIRLDSGIESGSAITIYYDSLLAKVAAWGQNREEARQTLIRALNGYHIEGLNTNVDFVNAVVNHPAFSAGDLSTGFIEQHFNGGRSIRPPDPETLHYMAIAAVLVYHTRQYLVQESLKPMSPLVGGNPAAKEFHEYVVRTDESVFNLKLKGHRTSRRWEVHLDGQVHEVLTPEFEYYRRRLVLKINGRSYMFRLQYDENHIKAYLGGLVRLLEIYTPKEWRLAGYMLRGRKEVQENVLKCPMPGLVTLVCVSEGEHVRKGQELVRMESMKMESGIASPRDALVDKILVQPGHTVDTGDTLLQFK